MDARSGCEARQEPSRTRADRIGRPRRGKPHCRRRSVPALGESTEDLEKQAASLRQQVSQKQLALARLRAIVSKVETARTDGDHFMDTYLTSKRTVSSTLLAELEDMAHRASIKQREISFSFEPVEGTDTVTKAVITATYEGAYADLTHFINQLDHSPRLLIIESLGAAPQQGAQGLGITMRLSAFVREGGAAPAVNEKAAGEEVAAVPPSGASPTGPPLETQPDAGGSTTPAPTMHPALVGPGGRIRLPHGVAR